MINQRVRSTLGKTFLLVGQCCLSHAQTGVASPAFEAASVKPSPPPANGFTFTTFEGGPGTRDPGRINYRNVLLSNIIKVAYNLNSYALEGPSWISDLRFDLVATLPAGSTREQLDGMLQNLLRERFGLQVHHKSKEMPGYALTVKDELKLKPTSDSSSLLTAQGQAEPWPPPGPRKVDSDGFPLTPPSPGVHPMCIPGSCRWRGNQATMAQFASGLSGRLRCPIVDETGTTSRFDFTLTYTFERNPDPNAPDSIVHDILRSLEPQLGLTLERKKVAADVLVIDHADKTPKEN